MPDAGPEPKTLARAKPRLAALAGTVLALALGAAGGAAANAVALPLAWMIGAMAVNTPAAVAGAPVRIPPQLRAVMVTVLGIMLGSAFTPELVKNIPRWLPSLSCLALYGAVVTAMLFVYFHRVAGYDRTTAYFSAVPGGLNEMLIIGSMMGGDDRTISLTHASRILLVVGAVPFWFVMFEGYDRQAARALGQSIAAIPLPDLAILAACAPLGMLLARGLRVPAANLTGPMLLSAAVHVAGLTQFRPPWELVAIAQVVVGSAVGCRFAGVTLRQMLRVFVAAMGGTVLMLTATAVFALVLHRLSGISAPALLLSYAPGGLAEMSLIALALGIDAAFVSTHHVFRIVLLVFVAPWVYRRFLRPTKADDGTAR